MAACAWRGPEEEEMNMMKTEKIDPITLQVIRGSIETIVEAPVE